MPAILDELIVADDPDAWRACGFLVEEGACRLGNARIRFTGQGEVGSLRWSLRGVAEGAQLDGLDSVPSAGEAGRGGRDGGLPAGAGRQDHPNGVTALDHLVAMTPDLGRTVAALQEAGLDLRRIREEPTPAGAPRQAFFRLGAVILEVVQEPGDAIERAGGDHPAFFWGLAFLAPELERTAASLGDRAGEPRDAVQAGRRIVTLRRSAGLALPVALMSPAPGEGLG